MPPAFWPFAGGRAAKARLRALTQPPRPLVDPTSGLILLWSPRAACTFATAWFMAVTGQRRGAGPLPPVHALRRRHFGDAAAFARLARRALRRRGPVVKLVRDPFERTLSVYFHCRKRPDILALLARDAGSTPAAGGLSFRAFVVLLGRVDLDRCDPHFRPQRHRVEARQLLRPDFLLRVERGLEEGLGQVAAYAGLPAVDFAAERDLFEEAESHRTPRRALGRFAGDEGFPDWEAPGFAAPLTAEFYDAALAGEVARLYAGDFTAYGYDPERFGPTG